MALRLSSGATTTARNAHAALWVLDLLLRRCRLETMKLQAKTLAFAIRAIRGKKESR